MLKERSKEVQSQVCSEIVSFVGTSRTDFSRGSNEEKGKKTKLKGEQYRMVDRVVIKHRQRMEGLDGVMLHSTSSVPDIEE